MNKFSPGQEWREVRYPPFEGEADYLTLTTADDAEDRYWVRKDYIPPLPTEPWTVIRVIWREKQGMSYGNDVGVLWPTNGWQLQGAWLTQANLRERITEFEVLAEPTPRIALYQEQQRVTRDVTEKVRRETAKAIVDRIRGEGILRNGLAHDAVDDIARDFGA